MNEKKGARPLPEGSESSDVWSHKETSSETKSPTITSEERSEGSGKDSTDQTSQVSVNEHQSEDEIFTIDDVVNKSGYGKFQKILTFLAGLGWLADAFEIIILSIIGDMMACDWAMERWQNALLTSVVFAGMCIGSPSFGWFADRYGRKKALALSMFFLFLFGAASAASPSYTWMAVLRGIMGFFLGGIAQGVTICCEFYPAGIRGRAGFYLSYYWSIGTIGVIGLAWIVMEQFNNWRIFVLASAVPALLVFMTMKWYPESARYYLVSNQTDKAYKILQRLAKTNHIEMPRGRLSPMDATHQMGKISDLMRPKMRRATLLYGYIWLASACAYYGVALITPFIVQNGSLLANQRKSANVSFYDEFRAIIPCKKFTNQNFIDLFWTSAAEFPGLLVFSMVVECCSRRMFLATTTIITAILMLLLMLEIKPEIALFLILFVVRALVAGVFQLLFIMTSETFPTTLRASALGMGSGSARLGGVIIPFLSQVTVISEPIASIFVLAGITFLSGIAAMLLPTDTRARQMEDYIKHS